MPALVRIDAFIGGIADTALNAWSESEPWSLTASAATVVRSLLERLPADVYHRVGEVAVHRSSEVETGAVVKGPCIVGAESFVASGAYLRGGVWLDHGCVVGPGSEVKSSFLFAGTALAHFNFVGDSLLGREVNLEAGSVIANRRNERSNKRIILSSASGPHDLPVERFGALVGDGTQIGANAVVAPGALLSPDTIIERLQLVDQESHT